MDMFRQKKFLRLRLASIPDLIYIAVFCLLIIAYILLILLPAPDMVTLHRYNLTSGHYRALIVPIIVFLVAIWLAALYGSMKVKSYANLIRRHSDGQAFNVLASGFMALAIIMPITSVLSSIINLVSLHHETARPALTIINNYIDVLITAVAMWLIYDGAFRLADLAGNNLKRWSETFWVFIFICFSALYGYFIVDQPINGVTRRAYYLPHWLLLISIVIPYLFFWYVGLKGAAQIFHYRRNVRGKLYKSSLRYLAAGITLVIVGSVLTRTLTTVSAKLSHLNLTPILIIIYGLLVVIAAGYLLIAAGAKKLRRLEEV